MRVASRQSLWRGEVKCPSHRLCRCIFNGFKVNNWNYTLVPPFELPLLRLLMSLDLEIFRVQM